jgi:hypothetical protein
MVIENNICATSLLYGHLEDTFIRHTIIGQKLKNSYIKFTYYELKIKKNRNLVILNLCEKHINKGKNINNFNKFSNINIT